MISDNRNWVTDAINLAVSLGATMASEEHFAARLAICDACPYQGQVDLHIPGLSPVMGCTLCGCPRDTKPRYLKYFSYRKLRITDSVCPDGRWAKADSIFSNKKN